MYKLTVRQRMLSETKRAPNGTVKKAALETGMSERNIIRCWNKYKDQCDSPAEAVKLKKEGAPKKSLVDLCILAGFIKPQPMAESGSYVKALIIINELLKETRAQ